MRGRKDETEWRIPIELVEGDGHGDDPPSGDGRVW